MTKFKRNRLIADPQVQGLLVMRLLGYWAFAWLVVLGLAAFVAVLFALAVEEITVAQSIWRMLGNFWLPILISVMVLPVLVRDCLRLSNRFAGPVMRVRRLIKQLADGEQPEKLVLREGDFWQDLADDCNRLLERVEFRGSANPPAK